MPEVHKWTNDFCFLWYTHSQLKALHLYCQCLKTKMFELVSYKIDLRIANLVRINNQLVRVKEESSSLISALRRSLFYQINEQIGQPLLIQWLLLNILLLQVLPTSIPSSKAQAFKIYELDQRTVTITPTIIATDLLNMNHAPPIVSIDCKRCIKSVGFNLSYFTF